MPKFRGAPTTDQQILNAYEETKSGQKVADRFNIGVTTVLRVLKSHGIERTGLGDYRKTMGDVKTEPYIGVYKGSHEEILTWYAEGLSMRHIAKKIGRSTRVVQKIVSRAEASRPFRATGADHSMWVGGRLDAGSGYIRQWISPDDPLASMRDHQGYIKEHRLVLARKLGRPLLETETVHHIDGDRDNNTPSNLELRQGQHGSGVVMYCMKCGSHDIGHTTIGSSVSVSDPEEC